MLARCAVPLVVASLLSLGGLSGHATAAQGRDTIVSHPEYRAIHRGLTPAQVDETTHGAAFTTDRIGDCTLRFYKGWSSEHAHVGVLLGPRHRVAEKQTWAKHEGFLFAC